MSSLGKRLKYARIKRGWTQLIAAEAVGVSSQNISNYERDYREPDLPTLNKISTTYNVPLQWLITGEDSDSSSPVNKTIFTQDERLKKLIRILDNMNDEQIEHILKTAEFIASKK